MQSLNSPRIYAAKMLVLTLTVALWNWGLCLAESLTSVSAIEMHSSSLTPSMTSTMSLSVLPSSTTMTPPESNSNSVTMSIIYMIIGVSIFTVTLSLATVVVIVSLWWKKKRRSGGATMFQTETQTDLIESEIYNNTVPKNDLEVKENVAYTKSETVTTDNNLCDYDYVINTDSKRSDDYDYVDSDTVRKCSLDLIATAPNDAYALTNDLHDSINTVPNDAM